MENQLENNILELFLTLFDFLQAFGDTITSDVIEKLFLHVKNLKETFIFYFSPLKLENEWIREPFHFQENSKFKTLIFL